VRRTLPPDQRPPGPCQPLTPAGSSARSRGRRALPAAGLESESVVVNHSLSIIRRQSSSGYRRLERRRRPEVAARRVASPPRRTYLARGAPEPRARRPRRVLRVHFRRQQRVGPQRPEPRRASRADAAARRAGDGRRRAGPPRGSAAAARAEEEAARGGREPCTRGGARSRASRRPRRRTRGRRASRGEGEGAVERDPVRRRRRRRRRRREALEAAAAAAAEERDGGAAHPWRRRVDATRGASDPFARVGVAFNFISREKDRWGVSGQMGEVRVGLIG